jgi:hypothetical protein
LAAAGADTVKIATASTATAAKTAGTAAPAYAANTMPSSYPSTGAQDYLLNSAAALKTAANSTVASTTAAAKAALPYDPTAVPPSTTASVTSSTGSTTANTDRYGMPSQDRYAGTYPETTPAYTPSSSPTGTVPSTTSSTPVASTVSPTSSVPYATNPNSITLGDRYATQSIPTTATVNTTVPNYSTPVQTASAVANMQPYRPGGTSSYPGTSASYEVATRPGSTSTSTAPSGTLYR